MKSLITLLLLLSFHYVNAQIHGNGVMKTETRYFDNIDEVLVNINGTVDIFCGSEENKMEITYDENIVSLVSTDYNKGLIEIGQEKWIEGSSDVNIKIFTNELNALINDSWSVITVNGLSQKSFFVNANISELDLNGSVDELILKIESATVDAYELESKNVKVKIKEDGAAFVNVSNELDVRKSEESTVEYIGQPKSVNGMANEGNGEVKIEPINTRFIDITFKNNSLSRIHAYVKGPKPDGKYFSYGLAFTPMSKKKERWSIGTKLYKVNKLGMKTLIHEVTAEDENQTIKLNKS